MEWMNVINAQFTILKTSAANASWERKKEVYMLLDLKNMVLVWLTEYKLFLFVSLFVYKKPPQSSFKAQSMGNNNNCVFSVDHCRRTRALQHFLFFGVELGADRPTEARAEPRKPPGHTHPPADPSPGAFGAGDTGERGLPAAGVGPHRRRRRVVVTWGWWGGGWARGRGSLLQCTIR